MQAYYRIFTDTDGQVTVRIVDLSKQTARNYNVYDGILASDRLQDTQRTLERTQLALGQVNDHNLSLERTNWQSRRRIQLLKEALCQSTARHWTIFARTLMEIAEAQRNTLEATRLLKSLQKKLLMSNGLIGLQNNAHSNMLMNGFATLVSRANSLQIKVRFQLQKDHSRMLINGFVALVSRTCLLQRNSFSITTQTIGDYAKSIVSHAKEVAGKFARFTVPPPG